MNKIHVIVILLFFVHPILFIPQGKVTAIVGASGRGKTTLMKMLLKFYKPTQGDIFFNSVNIKHILPKV